MAAEKIKLPTGVLVCNGCSNVIVKYFGFFLGQCVRRRGAGCGFYSGHVAVCYVVSDCTHGCVVLCVPCTPLRDLFAGLG
jgi:hypothetical protein